MVNPYSQGIEFAHFMGISTHAIANCVVTQAYNSDEDEICVVFTWSGAGTGDLYFMYQLPSAFYRFNGVSNDLSFRVKQTGDSGDAADVETAIEVYDNGGRNISDASLSSAVTSVGAWVDRDCGITNPDGDADLIGGDHILVKLTIAGTIENNDILIMTVPKIRCAIQN